MFRKDEARFGTCLRLQASTAQNVCCHKGVKKQRDTAIVLRLMQDGQQLT
jgi:hypothetical protein